MESCNQVTETAAVIVLTRRQCSCHFGVWGLGMTVAVTDIQFEFGKFRTPPGGGHTIFIGTRAYVVLSLDFEWKTGWARPFTEADNLRDPLVPILASRQIVHATRNR